MAKNPGDRYPSAGALATAAHRALSGAEQTDADTILADTQAASRTSEPATKSGHGKQARLSAAEAAVTLSRPTPRSRPLAGASPRTAGASAKLPPVPRSPSKLGDRLARVFPLLALLFGAVLITVLVGHWSSHQSPPTSPSSQVELPGTPTQTAQSAPPPSTESLTSSAPPTSSTGEHTFSLGSGALKLEPVVHRVLLSEDRLTRKLIFRRVRQPTRRLPRLRCVNPVTCQHFGTETARSSCTGPYPPSPGVGPGDVAAQDLIVAGFCAVCWWLSRLDSSTA
jgi:hypothetical protein